MKKRILLAVIGLGIVLTACSGQSGTSVQESAVQEMQESGTQQETGIELETETQQIAETESETETQETAETEQEISAQQATEQESSTQQATEQESSTQQESDAQAVQETEVSEQPAQAKGELAQADVAVTVRGISVAPGENMENYIGALGEPDMLESTPSCIEAGDDKAYTYAGVLIYSYRANGNDRINLIEITGTESIGKGIHIGDTTDTVIAAYGDGYTMEGNEMLYEINDRVIGLQMTDGKVSFIELFAR